MELLDEKSDSDGDDNNEVQGLTDEENALLDDPNTPEDVKENILLKLQEQMEALLSSLPTEDIEALREEGESLEKSLREEQAQADL